MPKLNLALTGILLGTLALISRGSLSASPQTNAVMASTVCVQSFDTIASSNAAAPTVISSATLHFEVGKTTEVTVGAIAGRFEAHIYNNDALQDAYCGFDTRISTATKFRIRPQTWSNPLPISPSIFVHCISSSRHCVSSKTSL